MTSKHTFEESSNPLAQLNYIPLLDKIIPLIQRKKIFKLSPDKNKLRISAYELAYEIAINSNQQPLNTLNKEVGVKAATVNYFRDRVLL